MHISLYHSECNANTAQYVHACLQLGIVPFAGVDIAAFEIFKEHLLNRYHGDPPPFAILGAGMMSSSIAQFASYPLALVRTRLQVSKNHYSSLKKTDVLSLVLLSVVGTLHSLVFTLHIKSTCYQTSPGISQQQIFSLLLCF